MPAHALSDPDPTGRHGGSVSPLVPALARAHRAKAHELLRGTGLSAGQELVIMRLHESPPQPQTEITRWLGVEPPTTAKMLARLERAGFVQRERSESDRRVVLVSLTDRGRGLYERVGQVWDELERVTTAGLSTDDKAELARLLRRLIDNLSPAELVEHVADDCERF
jgi:DNA-binding MarR family transcriptional regulator